MLGRVLASGAYLVGVALLFSPLWPSDHSALKAALLLGASVLVGFVVGKRALLLPWVLVVALVLEVAIYIEYINATSADVRIKSSFDAFAFILPNGVAALAADLVIALGILMREVRSGGFAIRFPGPS